MGYIVHGVYSPNVSPFSAGDQLFSKLYPIQVQLHIHACTRVRKIYPTNYKERIFKRECMYSSFL